MTGQPTEDPADPLVILRDLPEQEHEEFLRQYHQAVDSAHPPTSRLWQIFGGEGRLAEAPGAWAMSSPGDDFGPCRPSA